MTANQQGAVVLYMYRTVSVGCWDIMMTSCRSTYLKISIQDP